MRKWNLVLAVVAVLVALVGASAASAKPKGHVPPIGHDSTYKVCYDGETITLHGNAVSLAIWKALHRGSTDGECAPPPPPGDTFVLCSDGETVTIVGNRHDLAAYEAANPDATLGACVPDPVVPPTLPPPVFEETIDIPEVWLCISSAPTTMGGTPTPVQYADVAQAVHNGAYGPIAVSPAEAIKQGLTPTNTWKWVVLHPGTVLVCNRDGLKPTGWSLNGTEGDLLDPTATKDAMSQPQYLWTTNYPGTDVAVFSLNHAPIYGDAALVTALLP